VLGRRKPRVNDVVHQVGAQTMGAVAGVQVGGPAGAIVGAVVPGLLVTAADFVSQKLTARQEQRVQSVISFANAHLRSMLADGCTLRDELATGSSHGSSDFDEAIEGVLCVAQRDPEARKASHLGYLLAILAVEGSLDRVAAEWLISTAESLSWNQYVILAVAPLSDTDPALPDVDVMTADNWSDWALHMELTDLGYGQRELVRWGQDLTPLTQLPVPSINVSKMTLSTGGRLLQQALNLDMVEQEERDRVIATLRRARSRPS
jgi:hypothetical protein